jgi:hypothetical protein
MKIVWEKVNYSLDKVRDKWIVEEDTNEEIDHIISTDDDMFPVSRVVSTPMGIFEVDDAFNPLNHFNFWIANTDFDLTQNFVDTLDTIPGVEGIKVMSRYRFLLAIGTLFDPSKVRLLIELRIGTLSLSKNILDKKEELESSGKEWTMFVYPNLNSYLYTVEGNEDYEKTLKKIYELSDKGSGLVLSSKQ